MPIVQNTIALKLGNVLQGSAEGPLGIGALLVIVIAVIALAESWRRR
jgi:hypothetical protein